MALEGVLRIFLRIHPLFPAAVSFSDLDPDVAGPRTCQEYMPYGLAAPYTLAGSVCKARHMPLTEIGAEIAITTTL